METKLPQPKSSTSKPSWLQSADEYARHEPIKAVVSAAGAGFLVNLLPMGAIVGALASLAFALARPVLLFLGLMKIYELVRCDSTNQRNSL